MEKIILKNGAEFDLYAATEEEKLQLEIAPGGASVDSIIATFSDKKATAEIKMVTEQGSVMAVFADYTILASISYKKVGEDYSVVVNLYKADPVTVAIDALEQQMIDAELALCELYEMIGGR